jgi:hypothetical protein
VDRLPSTKRSAVVGDVGKEFCSRSAKLDMRVDIVNVGLPKGGRGSKALGKVCENIAMHCCTESTR